MSEKVWQPVKIIYCHHVGHEVTFEAELIYPSEWMPEQMPRVAAHRCSHAVSCNMDGRPSCIWAGTNPAIDPFKEL